MHELNIGDKVLVKSGVYEAVYSFGHRDEKIPSKYLQFLPSSLEVSHDHMVFVEKKGAIPAFLVEVGDVLLSAHGGNGMVEAIHEVKRAGAYSPFTASGTLVVNDVLASNYVSFQRSRVVKIGSFETAFSYHWLAHAFLAPCRIWSTGDWGNNLVENNVWVKTGLFGYKWLLDQCNLTRIVLMVPILLFLSVLMIAEFLLTNIVPFTVIALIMSYNVSNRFVKKTVL